MALTQDALAEAIAALNTRLYAAGLNTLRDGNISARRGNDILMTPSKYLGEHDNTTISAAAIGCWPLDGEPPKGVLASSEWRHHARVYRQSDQIGAIIHCHAPHATALGSHRDRARLIQTLGWFSEFQLYDHLPVLTSAGGIIPDLPNVEATHTILCAYHGVTAFGKDLRQAYERLERLEFYSRIVLLSGRA